MKCGQKIPPQSEWTTRDVEARVHSHYMGQRGGEHTWRYEVTFRNTGRDTVQMLSRHWVFVDMNGREHEMKGPGARGVTPVLGPGDSWSYESSTSLATRAGSMHGSFQFEVIKEHRYDASTGASTQSDSPSSFDVRIARLALSADGTAENAPCAEEPSEALLSDTSVRSTRRVIVGASSRFLEQSIRGTPTRGTASSSANTRYKFMYDVQFNNARDGPITVVGHRWHVREPEGGVAAAHEGSVLVEGDGVGGRLGAQELSLPPGEAARVQGLLEISSSRAVASGHYVVRVGGIEGELVNVAIGELALSSEGGKMPLSK